MKPPGYGATVAALALGQLLCWAVLYYGFTSFVLPMQRELGLSTAALMGAFTWALGLSGLASYAAGVAIDRGQGRVLMSLGSALGALGLLAWSQVQGLVSLVAAMSLVGLAMGATLYEPAFALLTKRYPTRYTQGITVLTLVAGFASTLSLPLCAALLAALSWRQALAVLGLLLLATAPLHAWALRGFTVAASATPGAAAGEVQVTLQQAVRHRGFWLLTACFTAFSFASAALWAHAMPVFAHKGLAPGEAALVLMAVGPAQVAGRLAFVALGRHWALRTLGLWVVAGLPLSMVVLALGRSAWALALFALLFGMANGLATILRGGLVPQYYGRAQLGRIGGLMSAVGLVARSGAPLAAALLLPALGGYTGLLWALALMGAAAWWAFWRARPIPRPAPWG